MSETPSPIPTIIEYGIVWTLKKGNAIYKCSDSILGDGTTDMERTSEGIPIVPSCGNSNDRLNDGEEEEQETLSFFHTEYKWNNVEISFDINDNGSDVLNGFEIEARVYSVGLGSVDPEDPNGPTKTFNEWVPYRVKSASIISDDPNSGGTWIYPDDYETVVDQNHPKQYGGVILFKDDTSVDKKQNEKFVCGIDDGNNKDGMVVWTDSNRNQQATLSAYNYVDVFDDIEFGYIPRNTYENKKMTTTDKFQFEPRYEDIKDENGLAAPIYPMNAVTAFVPDGRDSVTVTYTVSLNVVALDKNGREIKSPVKNPKVTIKQKVEQDTSDYIGQLEELGKYCQFQNPGGFKSDELSPNYNYDYPYTLVAGFDGVPEDGDTDTRGDDVGNEPLQRGDILYIPSTGERKTWGIADIPERLTIIDGGSGYRTNDNAITVKAFETDKSFDKERYPNGRPPRCYDRNTETVAIGLLLNIETKDGKIIEASISDTSSSIGWKDGDVIRVVGGNNNAEVRIHIDNPPGWTNKFIDKY